MLSGSPRYPCLPDFQFNVCPHSPPSKTAQPSHILCAHPGGKQPCWVRLWDPSSGARLSSGDKAPLPGLAIDFPESKLYWISSGNHTINRCNLDGSELEIIDAMRNQLGKATALAIMGEGCWVGEGTGAEQASWTGWGVEGWHVGSLPTLAGQALQKSYGEGPVQGSHPFLLPRGQAVVGRSGVREDGHMQQG